jgi:hypothetical protein
MNITLKAITLYALLALSTRSGYVAPFAEQVDMFSNIIGGSFCWKRTYGRGVGLIPNNCGSKVYENGLCYKKCKIGYSGNGPLCLQTCSAGYNNHPLSCYKNIVNWYFKKSYGRGIGVIPKKCSDHNEFQNGLCYRSCDNSFYGAGPVCWKQCSGDRSFDCGAACATSQGTCVTKIFEQIASVFQVIENVAELVVTLGGSSVLKSSAKLTMNTLYNTAKNAIKKGATRESFIKMMKSIAEKAGKLFTEEVARIAFDKAQSTKSFDWKDFTFLDPTGVADVIIAFSNDLC